MAMPGRFVAVPASKLIAAITAIGESVKGAGGTWGERREGNERVFWLMPPGRDNQVWVYSSLAIHAAEVRECGADAVRLVLGVWVQTAGASWSRSAKPAFCFRPLASSRRIYRTAPRSLVEPARVEAFLERLRDAIREAYREAIHVPKCPVCSAAGAATGRNGVLIAKSGSRGPFVGCSAYPRCNFTRDVPKEAVR